jgi:hypothetical protein
LEHLLTGGYRDNSTGTWIIDIQYILMRLVCCAVFLKVPLNIGFTTDLWETSWYLELSLLIALFLNVLFQLNVAVVDDSGALVTDFRGVLELYRNNGGTWEMLAAFPFSAIAHVAGVDVGVVNWMSLNQMFMVVRVFLLERKRLQSMMMDSSIILMVFLLMLVHVLTCIWFFMVCALTRARPNLTPFVRV